MVKRLSREEIERRLQELVRSPRPEVLDEDRGPGAMCYMPAAPPDHWTYVCPACGKRTAYVAAERAGEPWEAAPWTNRRTARGGSPGQCLGHAGPGFCVVAGAAAPKRSGISLDESALCAFCRPDAEEHVPVLEVKLPARRRGACGSTRRTSYFLLAFLKARIGGKTTCPRTPWARR